MRCVLASTRTKRSTAIAESSMAATKRDMFVGAARRRRPEGRDCCSLLAWSLGGASTASGWPRLPWGAGFERQTGPLGSRSPALGTGGAARRALRLDAARTIQGSCYDLCSRSEGSHARVRQLDTAESAFHPARKAPVQSVDKAPKPLQGHSSPALARDTTTKNPLERRGAAPRRARIERKETEQG